MSIEVVQCAICFFATVPSALVHSLDFFISSSRSLVLLSTRNWNKRVDLEDASVNDRNMSHQSIT